MELNLPAWLRSLPDTLSNHSAHPEVSLDDYRNDIRMKLASEVNRKHRIYLDTKYWIVLRDVSMGRSRAPADIDLLEVLTSLKTEGKVLCPLSYSSIHEMWFQDDLESRRATAKVMDTLSDAVCLQAPHYLFDIELNQLLYSALIPNHNVKHPRSLVWTKAAFYVGEPVLQCDAFSSDELLALQKSMDDALFGATLSDLIESMADRPLRDNSDLDVLASDLTTGKLENPESSFEELYRQEIIGGLEAHQDSCGQIMERACRATGFSGEIGPTERTAGGRMLRGLVEGAIRFGRIRTEFPQLHINASLHAALRWDARRTYKRGDCEDFRHAGSALPYCNYFLTEKSLRHLLCTKPLGLDSEYGVEVFSDSASASNALKRIL